MENNKYSTNPNIAFNEHDEEMNVLMQEEAHYYHTVNDFVSLIQVYGFEKVIKDLRSKMGELEW